MFLKKLVLVLAALLTGWAGIQLGAGRASAETVFKWGEWTLQEGLFMRRALPPMPLLGASTFVSQDGQWYRLAIVPKALAQPIDTPMEASSLGNPGKPFFWGPWVITAGRRVRVIFPFPEYQEGGFLVDPQGRWYSWDETKKRLRYIKPLEGYVKVQPGK